jgi:hypothetical protein
MPRLQFNSFATPDEHRTPGLTLEDVGAHDLEGLSGSRTLYRISASPG